MAQLRTSRCIAEPHSGTAPRRRCIADAGKNCHWAYATAARGLAARATPSRGDLRGTRATFEAPPSIALSHHAPDGLGTAWAGAGDAPAIAQRSWHGRHLVDVATRCSASRPDCGCHPPLGHATSQVGSRPECTPSSIRRRSCTAGHPGVRGADLAPFTLRRTRRLLWPARPNGEPWPSLPTVVARHLAPYEERLRTRADCSGARWWQLFRTTAACSRWRVTWSDLAIQLSAVALEPDGPVPLNSCYLIATADSTSSHALASWLNSTWIRALARITAEPAANG